MGYQTGSMTGAELSLLTDEGRNSCAMCSCLLAYSVSVGALPGMALAFGIIGCKRRGIMAGRAGAQGFGELFKLVIGHHFWNIAETVITR
jgi:hypothetical protein